MYREHTIGVVVPAYNEEGFIGEVIETIPSFVDRIYVIDDCSTDRTWNKIQKAREKLNQNNINDPQIEIADGGLNTRKRVVPIQHEENRGVGGAIKTGYKRALEDEIDITAVMGGDGQMDPNILERFLDPLVEGKVDYTKGNRLLYREYRNEMSRWRFVGNSILTFLTKIASGYWKMMDPQNGYTAITHYALKNVDVESMYEYYGYCNDLLVKLNTERIQIADIAMPAVYGDEISSIRYHTYIRKVSSMLLGNFLWRLKTRYLLLDFHPLALFYIFGAIIALGGFVGLIGTLFGYFLSNHSLFVRTSLSLMLFSIGSMFLMFAMLFDMQVNEDLEIQIQE